MVYLGTISYSLYLVHWPVLTIFRSILPASTPLPLRLVITLSVAILCAALTYHSLRRPAGDLARCGGARFRRGSDAAVQAG